LIVHIPDGKPYSTLLPVGTEHVGWVILPNKGADGTTGGTSMINVADGIEVQPSEFVTVYAYDPGCNPDKVILDPFPVIAPGLRVQVPDGKPNNTLLPVGTVHVGWVILPNKGADGTTGGTSMINVADGVEVQPFEFVTVNAYDPGCNPDRVTLGPLPVIVPGLRVHVPDGKPYRTLLPVGTEHVGWVMVPNKGAVGAAG
jgi:hypothetical protein